MDWKDRLKKVDTLIGSSNGMLYDRLKMLRAVFDDPAYKADCKKSGRGECALLVTKVSDVAASLDMLFLMLQTYPNRSQWTAGNLHQMQLHVASKQIVSQKKNGKKKAKPIRHQATLAQVRELEDRLKDLQKELQVKESTIEKLQAELTARDGTIGELKKQLGTMQDAVDMLKSALGPKKVRAAA